MTPALLLPAGLAALAALALPLLIHIARRSEMRLTDFAALRWLSERPRPRHRLRFDEWLLLAMRLLLLALVGFWLARPVVYGSISSRPWTVVAPGIDASVAHRQADPRTDLHWLAPGFPAIDAPPPRSPGPVASLLRELDATLPATTALTVLVPPVLEGADAERPRLSRGVGWKIVGDAAPMPTSASSPKPKPLHLALRSGPGATGFRYIRAATLALDPTADVGPPDKPLGSGVKALVWFAAAPLPPDARGWVERGGTVLVAAETAIARLDRAATRSHDHAGQPLIEGARLGRGRLLRFTRPLTPEALPELFDADFAARIGAVLRPDAPAPARVAAGDYAPERGGPPPARPITELRPWLALVIAALVLGERWLATSRRRTVAP